MSEKLSFDWFIARFTRSLIVFPIIVNLVPIYAIR
jgi:hypothetical protein